MVHRALKLQHHQHTAKRLRHEHTSYRGLFVVLALTALCAGTIQSAAADDYTVSATVPSSSLTQPAVITNPAPNTVFSTNPVGVSGTCQVVAGGTIVVLERDGVTLGSQACQSDGTFSLGIMLQAGNNLILPKVYTSGFVAGPDGQPVNLVLSVPPVGGSGSTGTQTTVAGSGRAVAGPAKPLTVQVDRSFLAYISGQPVRLSLDINGGTAPYNVVLNWGDGSQAEQWTVKNSGTVNYEHSYQVDHTYAVTVTLMDARGEKYSLQMATLSLRVPAVTLVAPERPFAAVTSLFNSPVTRIVWGTYGVIAVVTGVLWSMSPTHSLLWRGPGPGHWLLRRRS